jgi:hypothetical protein
LKRWKAYVTWCSGDLRGRLLLACTDERMPQFRAKMYFTSVIDESRKWNFGVTMPRNPSYLGS